MEVNSGWQGETKLKLALEKLNIAIYTQESGKEVLVDADELAKQRRGVE